MFTKLRELPRFLLLAVVLSTLTGFVTGCMDPNLQFIEGTWHYDDEHLKQVAAEQHLEITWSFHRGRFAMTSCCFGEAEMTGNYRILKSEGDKIVLELYNQQGHEGGHVITDAHSFQMNVALDRETGTLRIGRFGPYERVD